MLKAFRPLRYNRSVVGDLAAVVAPPYDVISDRQRDALYDRSEHNSVRLELSRESDRYGAAATLLAQWRDRGVLVRDRQPTLCYYVENFDVAGTPYERTGLISTVRLEAFADGNIRPHERTFPRAKQDRMNLLRACRTNLSAIFGLVAGPPDLLAPAAAEARKRSADIDLQQDNGWRHRIWLLTGNEVIRALEGAFARETVFIADGHHRYETALEYRDLRRQEDDGDPQAGYNFIMMYLTSMQDPGVVVLPTHRVLGKGSGIDCRGLLERLKDDFVVSQSPAADAVAFHAALAAAPRGKTFGLGLNGDPKRYLVTLRNTELLERSTPGMAAAVRALDVTLLDAVVLRGLAGIDSAAAERDGHLTYTHDDADAEEALKTGAAAVFFLAPPRLEDVKAVCLSGETMPQKSTYFFPKLLTGLVFNPLDDTEA